MGANIHGKMNRKSVLAAFELERQEWLAMGVSEDIIHKIHFGEPGGKELGGDYAMWLSERRHRRADHKYAPGAPAAIDAVDPDGSWISGGVGGLADAETQIDLAMALGTLTGLQRHCFVAVIINDQTQRSVARELGITQQMVGRHKRAAKKKLAKFFRGWL